MTTYRLPRPAPTEYGWYYARFTDETSIEPTEVAKSLSNRAGHLSAWMSGSDESHDLSEFVWYGPVPICKEG